jgi:shikimate kinase
VTEHVTRPALVLVGPPGAGKSTVGALVAEQLGLALRDTDADVEEAAGARVADIFLEQGEQAFRALERAAVAAALAEHPGVVALGGGAVMDPGTRELLVGHRVAYLEVGVGDALRRVGLNRDRPLLVGNLRGQWLRLMEERRPQYAAVATWTLSTDGRDAADVAAEVLRLLRETA